MPSWIEIFIPVLITLIASSGFWAFIIKKLEKKDAMRDMLVGLAHDRIMYLGLCYIERESITSDEFENLYQYLYVPYKKLNGNGSAERVMKEVDKLPIRQSSKYTTGGK